MFVITWSTCDRIHAKVERACAQARIARDEGRIRDLVRIIVAEPKTEGSRLGCRR